LSRHLGTYSIRESCFFSVQIEFFSSGEDPCTVLDEENGVLFVKKPDGRATGDAFVLFRYLYLLSYRTRRTYRTNAYK